LLVDPDDMTSLQNQDNSIQSRFSWVWIIILIGILAIGAYVRFIGLDWDDNHHLHPDERFMTMVTSSVSSVDSLRDYFDTNTSSLNPNNRGYGFYVYGTLPLFVVRYLGEWLDMTGYGEVYLVGRAASAVVDLLTVILVYLIGVRLFRKKLVGLLAAAFSALAVLQIQLSHYYTVDTFTTFFTTLAFYFAVLVMQSGVSLTNIKPPASTESLSKGESGDEERPISVGMESVDEIDLLATAWKQKLGGIFTEWRSLTPYILFGVALGLAVASKISAVPVAILLPAAVLIYYFKLPKQIQPEYRMILLRNLVVAAIVSLIVFRFFQPYAFSGPGIFGLKLNPKWLSTMQSLQAQTSGDVDFPPALQWANRPVWFSWENMVTWGLGLPLGLLAWAGFIWMGLKVIKGAWSKYSLIWVWTAIYFVWQSSSSNSSMRYQLIIYPMLGLIAAWAVSALWGHRFKNRKSPHLGRILALILGIGVLLSTFAWAFAFTRIYSRPMTRVAASEWIYQNIPGPINLQVTTLDGEFSQPLPTKLNKRISANEPMIIAFQPRRTGLLTEVNLSHVVDDQLMSQLKALQVIVTMEGQNASPLSKGILRDVFTAEGDPRGSQYSVQFETPLLVEKEELYYLSIDVAELGYLLRISGPMAIGINLRDGQIYQQALPEPMDSLKEGQSYQVTFKALQSGTLHQIYVPKIVDWEANPELKTLLISIAALADPGEILGSSEIQAKFIPATANSHGWIDPGGQAASFEFNPPITLEADTSYSLILSLIDGPGAVAIYGYRQANESTWDDVLPLGMYGYNPFDYNSGIYRTDLNFEMYWDDNQEKFDRFINNIEQADVIFITSNRQWGTTVRVPERYPLTTVYYRNLIGCPEDEDILWCYSVAEPGMFEGELGFELIKVFQSDPNLSDWRINTQFAEEAFTVYDHPKVMIFRKNFEDFDAERVRSILGKVDLNTVQHPTPGEVKTNPGNLQLPSDRLAKQRAGGTWSALFKRESILNQYPIVGLIVWYLAISLLGLIVYPTVRIALGGMNDRGYPFSRLIGLLMLAYLVWIFGSFEIPFTRMTILLALIVLLLINSGLYFLQRKSLAREWRDQRKTILIVEGLTLAFFLLFLFIRLGNPDLWHPYKGGEKPMDFSYFNAVLKSTNFPPYDPWFAGGYINYYYYGFVLAGVPAKALGIIPSIAYNFILPTFFSMLAMGAFSIGKNLASSRHTMLSSGVGGENGCPTDSALLKKISPKNWGVEAHSIYAGIVSAFSILIIGNLGTVRMIWRGFQRLSAPGGNIEDGNIFQRTMWLLKGLGEFISGSQFSYYPGDWYWIPSRAIPGEPITEFPFFSFLYADPHAHLFALPLTVLALGWGISILFRQWRWVASPTEMNHGERINGWLAWGVSFVLGGLILGAFRPINTWDMPTYLALGVVVVVFTALRYWEPSKNALPGSKIPWLGNNARKMIVAVLSAMILVGLAFLLYQPYAHWYGAGYTEIKLWDGAQTQLRDYITHWGVFLFIIISWMFWETRDWMAKTPLSSLNKLRPVLGWIQGGTLLLVGLVVALLVKGIVIGWVVLPIAAWAGLLILRPGQADGKRIILLWIGTALFLTIAVELIVLSGDIGRMNTVFKFYLQAWTLFALSAAAGLMWLIPAVMREWLPGWKVAWQIVLSTLVLGAAMFPITASVDKIRDRMAKDAPHTLDGMAYMDFASYADSDHELDLSQDYRAILWMQDNIEGSPVIVEANTPEYRWGSRFTIYTGLPGVVGWNWHQRQQRAITPSEWVTDRVDKIREFYTTDDQELTQKFLQRYDVRYIVLGQLERANYPGIGLEKFGQWDGELWKMVYQDGQTEIYEVLE
jgi:YYY domain-containing protein